MTGDLFPKSTSDISLVFEGAEREELLPERNAAGTNPCGLFLARRRRLRYAEAHMKMRPEMMTRPITRPAIPPLLKPLEGLGEAVEVAEFREGFAEMPLVWLLVLWRLLPAAADVMEFGAGV